MQLHHLLTEGSKLKWGEPIGKEIVRYVGVLISLWLFLFAAQPKDFFLDGLKKLEQRNHKCVELRGEYANTFFQSRSFLFSL
jgi:hypothetical protein